MCGISGVYDLSSSLDLLAQMRRMSQVVEHRGPDDVGWVVFGRNGEVLSRQAGEDVGPDAIGRVVGLGHQRLSIIDLSRAGHQPMSDPTGRYWIVHNGEIYNYVELRSELAARGRQFRSSTDTEVVLQAFLEWGAECQSRFNGMWAFAIYDRKDGTLFCSRDRFGIKPFCYAIAPRRFVFGSEAKQIVSLPWVGAKANLERVADFFLWGLENHTDESFFSGVHSLPASHYLMLAREDLERGRLQPVRYWSPAPVGLGCEQQAIQEFRELVFDSVRLRLRSDVPVGVTLSGGLDSSSVVCVAGEHRRASGDRAALSSFNVEFAGESYSERGFAEAAANKAGARSIVLRPNQEDLTRDWPRFVWHMEQPFSSLSYFSNFQIYRLIREQGIPVVLSGQGGDELLLGYERYRSYDAVFALKAGRPLLLLAEMLRARRHAAMSLPKQLAYGLYFSLPWLRAARRRNLVRPVLKKGFYHDYSTKTEHLERSAIQPSRHALQQSELFHYQLPHLLHHEDRVSMAHSVETRLPFLDYRLLELVLGQPANALFRDGWSKYILRQAMNGILPEGVRRRTDKMGYETPTGRLIRQNRQLFLPLLQRHRDDPILDVRVLERRFDADGTDERLLCGAVSYLSWKEAYSVS